MRVAQTAAHNFDDDKQNSHYIVIVEQTLM